MNSSYYIDTINFSVDKLRNILKRKDILPGRIVLKDQIDKRFDMLKSKNIHSLADLLNALKSKSKIEKFSKETHLSVEYLTILRREAGSYISVPVKLGELPFIETDIIKKLELKGIKDSKQLFDTACKPNDRAKLAESMNIPYYILQELVQLCDLVRITGVGPVFARIIYDSGIYSAEKFVSYKASLLFEKLVRTNEEKGLTKARFTARDIDYCMELGKELPIVFEL